MNRRRPPLEFAFLLGALLLVDAAALRAAVDASAWKYRQSFELAAPGLTKIALPAETLDAARTHLPDLRLLAPSGQEVPYAIEIPLLSRRGAVEPKSFRVRQDRTFTSLTLETGLDSPFAELELVTPARHFVKAARVEVSRDGASWETVLEGAQLSRADPSHAPSIVLPEPVTAAFIRVTLDDDRSPPIAFTGARLHLPAFDPPDKPEIDAQLVRREEFLRETVLTLDLRARNLPIAEIEFDVADPLFARDVTVCSRTLQHGESVEQVLAAGSLQRSAATPNPPERPRIRIHATVPSRELQIRIANGNNAPLALSRVIVRRRPVWLLFHAPTAGAYTLLTGHPHATAPHYDVHRFTRDFGSLPQAAVEITPLESNPHHRRPDALAEAPLLGPPLDTSRWKHRRAIASTRDSVQELELDLEVLARARPDLADLRLVANGRQVPYLIERTSLLRRLALEPHAENDPKRPNVSRWKLPLPHPNLPLQRLTLDSPAALFSRHVRLFERTTDHRGEIAERPLAPLTPWSRTPGQPASSRVIELSAPPETNALYVEIDHGDNPPFALNGVSAAYPVTRLLFRSPAEPIALHYGNADARAPVYDLSLVAPQLLHDERHPAALAAPAAGAASRTLESLAGGPLLWGALALVVVVLLAVVARLLPKPPAAS